MVNYVNVFIFQNTLILNAEKGYVLGRFATLLAPGWDGVHLCNFNPFKGNDIYYQFYSLIVSYHFNN